jgi:hypothetical protein
MTMAYRLQLEEHNVISNSNGLAHIAKFNKDSIKADIGLRIIRLGPEALDFTLHGPLIEDPDLNLNGRSQRPANEIFTRVEVCRQDWKKNIVDLKTYAEDRQPNYQFPFQNAWDFADDPSLLDRAGPALARAGDSLFKAIFELKCDEGLKEVGQSLRSILKSRSCFISITSDDLFLPWGLLYTHPIPGEKLASDGSNWEKEGFWGYQHIVQQNPNRIKPIGKICLEQTGSSLLSVNFDDRLAADLKLPVIDAHINFIGGLAGEKRIKRTKKTELAFGFKEERARLERIIYFYCHGHGSSDEAGISLNVPHLVLTDGVITASDFEDWSEGQHLPTSPLIFINACQGGQMQTMFYEHFAKELLKEGAAGVIGPQIDVPAVFASAYGQLVFAEFFGKAPIRMGPLLLELNRAMWDTHNNPLGLVYSLYRGVNCFIDLAE